LIEKMLDWQLLHKTHITRIKEEILMSVFQVGICVIFAFAGGLVVGIFIEKTAKFSKQQERLNREREKLIDSL